MKKRTSKASKASKSSKASKASEASKPGKPSGRKPLTTEQKAVLIARLAKARAARGQGGKQAATRRVLKKANKGASGAAIDAAAARVDRAFSSVEPVFEI